MHENWEIFKAFNNKLEDDVNRDNENK